MVLVKAEAKAPQCRERLILPCLIETPLHNLTPKPPLPSTASPYSTPGPLAAPRVGDSGEILVRSPVPITRPGTEGSITGVDWDAPPPRLSTAWTPRESCRWVRCPHTGEHPGPGSN